MNIIAETQMFVLKFNFCLSTYTHNTIYKDVFQLNIIPIEYFLVMNMIMNFIEYE